MEKMGVPIMDSFQDATELAGPVMDNVKRFALSLSLSLSLALALSLFVDIIINIIVCYMLLTR
jgi:hypothetical protein